VAVPKKRKTSARGKQKRSHHALSKPTLIKCPQCGDKNISHTVCATCGRYDGKEIIHVETKLDRKLKKEAKNKEKQEE